MAEFLPWYVRKSDNSKQSPAPGPVNVETQNVEEGGFHLLDLHIPINMDGGMLWIVIVLIGAAALLYFHRQRIRKDANKKAFGRTAGNLDDFRRYREWVEHGQPVPPTTQPAQLSIDALLPLLQILSPQSHSPPAAAAAPPPDRSAYAPSSSVRFSTLADVHRSTYNTPTGPSRAASPIASDPVRRHEDWQGI